MPTDDPIVSACCGSSVSETAGHPLWWTCNQCGRVTEALRPSTRNAILLEQWERDRDAVAFLPMTGTVVDAFNALDATRPTP